VINHTGKESTDDVDVGVDEKGLYDGSGVESSGHESPDSANDPVKQSIGEFLDVCCGIILYSISSNTFFLFSIVINHTGKKSTDDVDSGVDEKGLYSGSGVESLGHESTDGANDDARNADDAGKSTSKKGSDDDGCVVCRGSDGK
jgi:hypothetical protein